MKKIDFKSVDITGGYWADKQRLNREVTLGAVWDRFSETGRIGSLKCRWYEGNNSVPKPHIFWDADVAKLLEGIAYVLEKTEDSELERKLHEAVSDIEANQWEDGYINSCFTVVNPEARLTRRRDHELFCLGHLIEAAIAYEDATGSDKLLNCVKRYIDLVERVFITEGYAPFKTPGHEEIELALLNLYEYTRDEKYLNMAKFFIDERGKGENGAAYGYITLKYGQNHLPCREQETAEGHAVRGLFLYAAMVHFSRLTGNTELFSACQKIFSDMTEHKMYITGGLGSSYLGEAFTVPYDLPNQRAYAETCASIAMAYFCSQMSDADRSAVYADIIERELYNGIMSGISLDGDKFFYENPLEINLKYQKRNVAWSEKEHLPITQRVKVFGCSCCPPNLVRFIASVGNYIYSLDNKNVYVNQFMESEAECDGVKICQKTDFPRSGKVTIEVDGAEKLYVRIPSWCREFTLDCPYTLEDGWAVIDSPETVSVDFKIKPYLVGARSEVSNNIGRAAVQYGPFVYAFEGIDNIENLHSLYIDKALEYTSEYSEYFSADILKFKGYRRITDTSLYSEYTENFEDFTLTAIPYAGFANRGESDMIVWVKVK